MSFIFSSQSYVQLLISGIFNTNFPSPTCAIESGCIGCVWDQSSNFSAIEMDLHKATCSKPITRSFYWRSDLNVPRKSLESATRARLCKQMAFFYFKLQTAGLHKENITLVKCSIGWKQSDVLPPWNNIPARKTKWRVRAKNKCQSVLISQWRAICANLSTEIWNGKLIQPRPDPPNFWVNCFPKLKHALRTSFLPRQSPAVNFSSAASSVRGYLQLIFACVPTHSKRCLQARTASNFTLFLDRKVEAVPRKMLSPLIRHLHLGPIHRVHTEQEREFYSLWQRWYWIVPSPWQLLVSLFVCSCQWSKGARHQASRDGNDPLISPFLQSRQLPEEFLY